MPAPTLHHSKSGQFAPSQSGNPGGRPKDEHRFGELARSYTLEAIETLADLMRHGKDERVRGTAAQALLDRGCWTVARETRTLGLETWASNLISSAPFSILAPAENNAFRPVRYIAGVQMVVRVSLLPFQP